MALDTVGDYVAQARVLLQDATVPYRYTDDQMKDALGAGVYEARKLRPDLFLGMFSSLPDIKTGTVDGTALNIDHQYRWAFVYFIVAHMHLRDEEEAAENRAGAYRAMFVKSLLSVAV